MRRNGFTPTVPAVNRALLSCAVLLLAILFSPAHLAAQRQPAQTSCTICHAGEMFDAAQVTIVEQVRQGVHGSVGLSCHNCHGGNHDPALAEDPGAAMDPGYAPNPYIGIPQRAGIPEFCGRCHSSLAFMRRFDPDARTDQVQEYWTSQHGEALAAGETKAATCTDCHGVHGILRNTNPKSRVYPTNVAETCGTCHSDPQYMQGFAGDFGQPLPIDQVARWRRSVHAAAMFERGDLSAPTCNDCHGDHGATPPGVESIAFVCGQCHGREAEIFRASPKQAGFVEHNGFLEGGATCDSCHEGMPENILAIRHFTQCVTCHENHAVVRPTIALLGTFRDTPCAFCHEPEVDVPEPGRVVEHYTETKNRLVAEAKQQGGTAEDQFDWLVAESMRLEYHQLPGDEPEQLRPEFARLFEKFRIGTTRYTYADPVTGEPVVVPLRQCGDCHIDPDSAGARTATQMLHAMSQVIGMTARADRILLAAERGGVEVGEVHEALDRAIDNQIELEVLVHTFDAEGEFAAKYEEATTHARSALDAGQEALHELSYRRTGLLVALGIIILVLIALGLKIRQMSAADPEE